MRDALSLTDQAIALGNGTIQTDIVSHMLGTIDTDQAIHLLESISSKQPQQAMDKIQQLASNGVEWDGLLQQLASQLHRVAMYQALPSTLDQAQPDAEKIELLSKALTPQDVLMMSPEFLFRMELGLGEELPDGRRMLSPREIAYALSFALFDYVDPKALAAAEQGRLSTKEDVAREFRRMMSEPDRAVRGAVGKYFWVTGKGAGIEDPKLLEASHPRLLRFFREFFGYLHVREIFKDDTRHDGKHNADELVNDADWLVLW